jgi:hypothetical protein
LPGLTRLPGLTGLPRLALLSGLTLLPRLPLLTGVREVPTGVLELRRRAGQVPIGRDGPVRVLERVAESVQGVLGRCRVALGDALNGILQRLSGCTAGLAGSRLLLGEGRSHLAPLLGRHSVELLAQILQVPGGGLRVAVLVRIRLARRSA